MRTVLIGNGPSAIQRELGREIDSYNRVVRINRCSTAGFEKQLGTRTDLWLVNFHYLAGRFHWPNPTPQPRTICCVHAFGYKAMAKLAEQQQVELVPFSTVMEVFSLVMGYHCSVGLIGTVLLKPCDILGFDHWSQGNHYGDSLPNPRTHRPDLERSVFDRLEKAGLVRRI